MTDLDLKTKAIQWAQIGATPLAYETVERIEDARLAAQLKGFVYCILRDNGFHTTCQQWTVH